MNRLVFCTGGGPELYSPVQWLESSWQQCGEVFVRSGDDVGGLDHRVGGPEDGCQSRAKYSGACIVCYSPASLPLP